jgi:hypothetical protein
MRRALLVIVAVAAVITVAVTLAFARRGGNGDHTVATVGRQRISQRQLDLTVDHFREEAAAENHPFPKSGTSEYRVVQRQSLGLLLDRARLAEAAGRLGVHVSDAMVQRRVEAAGSGESEDGAEAEADAARAFLRSTARAQLITEAVFATVTAPVRVSAAAVRAYYIAHRAVYGGTPFTAARRPIRAQLLAARRNAVMARWLRRARKLPAHVSDAELR